MASPEALLGPCEPRLGACVGNVSETTSSPSISHAHMAMTRPTGTLPDGSPRRGVLHMIRDQLRTRPGSVPFRWLRADGSEADKLSVAQRWARSGAIAQRLISPEVGLRRGDMAMITFPIGMYRMRNKGCCVYREMTPCSSASRPRPGLHARHHRVHASGRHRVSARTSRW